MRAKKFYTSNVINNHHIANLQSHSKNVKTNDCFYNLGDDDRYVNEAIENGALTVVTSVVKEKKDNINYIIEPNVRKRLALDLYKLNKKLFKNIKIIGVTGTNGKTTTTTLVYKYLRYLGLSAILIGTNGIYINDSHYSSINTTPGICDIYSILKLANKLAIKYVIMEVSSHSIKMMRIFNIPFYIAGFTNLTQDHLDFHKSFADYLYTKALFLSNGTITLLNSDDEHYLPISNICKNAFSYGTNGKYKIANIEEKNTQTIFDLMINGNTYKIVTSLLASYNVYNIALMVAIIDKLQLLDRTILDFLKLKITIPGRMEIFSKGSNTIVVDYAHSPDSVEKVLKYWRSRTKARVLCLIGSGGNRDKTKRRYMGLSADCYADKIYLTSDNSRDENPKKIINMIASGIKDKDKIITIVNRKEAIEKIIADLEEDDVALILGRGNEEYMIEKNEKIPLNDIVVVKQIIQVS